MDANIYYHISVSGLVGAKFKATDFVFSKEAFSLSKNSSIIACWDISPANAIFYLGTWMDEPGKTIYRPEVAKKLGIEHLVTHTNA